MRGERTRMGMVGDCYEAAANALLVSGFASGVDLPDEAVLVHGRPTLTREPFEEYGHAWLELGDVVFEVANGRDIFVRRERYYEVGRIDPEHFTPFPKNPKTSYLAALSLISAVKKISGSMWIGV